MRPSNRDIHEPAPGVFCLALPGRTQTNVYLVRSQGSWVLIDAGWEHDAQRIAAAAASIFGAASRPEAIALTHVHPDHEGAALALARRWDRQVFIHPAELPFATGDFEAMGTFAGPLDRWVILPAMRAMGRRRREALLARSSLGPFARPFDPVEGVPGLAPEWQVIHAPGHTPGHVAYLRTADRVLISGDAIVTLRVNSLSGFLLQRQGISGPPWYTTWDRDEARSTLARLAALEPTVLAGGHGAPLTDPGTASRLQAFARRHDRADAR